MALTFGKGNRSVAFNPTSAFPLDARSYFESYALALAAAQGAEEAGSSNTQYYFGQTLVVVENGAASFYTIQPDNTLSKVLTKVDFNVNAFAADVDGKINLLGFAAATAGAQLTKGADGKLSWVKPDTSTVEGLSTTVATLRQDVNKLTQNTYTKTETETKIAEAIANSAHLKRKIVADLAEASDYVNNNADSVEYIFMVPATGSGITTSDRYDEYMAIETEEADGTKIRVLEKVGSWEVDLSDYATTQALSSGLSTKVDKKEGERLITDDEAAKLRDLLPIEKVDDTLEFNVDTNTLGVKQITATQVTDLASWISQNAATTPGLSEINFTTTMAAKLATIANGAEKNYIRSVNENEFTVSDNGQLGIKSIVAAQVADLSTLLDGKVDKTTFAELNLTVNTLSDRLTWGELK